MESLYSTRGGLSSTLDDEMCEHFAAWLKEEIRRRGMTAATAAERIGVSSGRMSEWLNAKRPPSLESMQKIADAFYLDLEVVLRKAEILPEIEPLHPTAEMVIGMVKRIQWSGPIADGREFAIKGVLQNFLDQDARERNNTGKE